MTYSDRHPVPVAFDDFFIKAARHARTSGEGQSRPSNRSRGLVVTQTPRPCSFLASTPRHDDSATTTRTDSSRSALATCRESYAWTAGVAPDVLL